MDNRRRHAICLFIDNYHDLRKHLRFKTSPKILRLSSLILSLKGIRINIEDFQKGLDYIKRYTQWYSPFRSFMVPAAAFATIPGKSFDKAFNRLVSCQKTLKFAGFRPSACLVPAAMALYSTSADGSEQPLAYRAYFVLQKMKGWRSARSVWELFAPAVFVSSSESHSKDIISQRASFFSHLDSMDKNQIKGLHFLYQNLAYDAGTVEAAAASCAGIYSTLEKMKFRSSALFYGAMGFLALSGHDCNQAILDAMDTMSLLKLGKCFSNFEKEQAMLVASAIVAANRLEQRAEASPSAIHSVISAQAAACLL